MRFVNGKEVYSVTEKIICCIIFSYNLLIKFSIVCCVGMGWKIYHHLIKFSIACCCDVIGRKICINGAHLVFCIVFLYGRKIIEETTCSNACILCIFRTRGFFYNFPLWLLNQRSLHWMRRCYWTGQYVCSYREHG